MKPETHGAAVALPAALLAEVEAAAEQEHRPASDVVREAVEWYLRQSRQHTPAEKPRHVTGTLTAAQAVERILEQRRGNLLPEGLTIRELMTHGRA